MKKNSLTRRRFMYGVATVAGATFAGPYLVRAAEVNKEKIRVACVGVGGKGDGDSDQSHLAGGQLMALCDVDEGTLNNKAKKYPTAKLYRDFRKMLSEMDKSIDAVTVSCPDHCHGLAAGTALTLGKHVYCQKPLTQTVYEARKLRELAKEKKVATQMGNQGSAEKGLRRAVEVIHAGLIGPITEVHVWSNRPIWPQGVEKPRTRQEVPKNLDWDLWLGPAQVRDYGYEVDDKGKKIANSCYHPFAWRGWYDFGTGALGDMACHTVNMPFRAVKMGYPTVVECEIASRMNTQTYPKSSRLRFEFPERDGLPACKFWWYDGDPTDTTLAPLRPSADVTKEIVEMKGRLPGSGALLIGEKGKIFSGDDYGASFYALLKGETKYKGSDNHEAVKAIEANYPKPPDEWPAGSPGSELKEKDGKPKKFDTDQAMKIEWFKMIQDGTPSFSNFDIAAYLTEIILLGCIAMRVGEGVRMEWDGPNMKSTNVPEAAKFVKRDSRPGWEL